MATKLAGSWAAGDAAASLCIAAPSAAPAANHPGPGTDDPGTIPDHGFCCLLGCGALAAAALPPASPRLPCPAGRFGEPASPPVSFIPATGSVLPVGARAPPAAA